MAAITRQTLNTGLYGMFFAYTRKLIKSKQYNNSHMHRFLTEGASISILRGTEIYDGRHHISLLNYDQTNTNYNFLERRQYRQSINNRMRDAGPVQAYSIWS